MKHSKQIIVNCWKCKKPFDIVTAERCYEHLNKGSRTDAMGFGQSWTTKCTHCGACICHKAKKMIGIECDVLNNVGIMRVMPSVEKQIKGNVNQE